MNIICFLLFPGSGLSPFSSSQTSPTTSMMNPNWGAGIVKTEEGTTPYDQHQQLPLLEKHRHLGSSSSSFYKGGKQLSFFEDEQLSLSNHATSEPVASHGCKMFYSDCALSLLSSPQTQSPGIGLSHMVQPSSPALAQPSSAPRLHYNDDNQTTGFGPISGAAGVADVHCHGVFHMGSDGSSSPGNEAPQRLPYFWD